MNLLSQSLPFPTHSSHILHPTVFYQNSPKSRNRAGQQMSRWILSERAAHSANAPLSEEMQIA